MCNEDVSEEKLFLNFGSDGIFRGGLLTFPLESYITYMIDHPGILPAYLVIQNGRRSLTFREGTKGQQGENGREFVGILLKHYMDISGGAYLTKEDGYYLHYISDKNSDQKDNLQFWMVLNYDPDKHEGGSFKFATKVRLNIYDVLTNGLRPFMVKVADIKDLVKDLHTGGFLNTEEKERKFIETMHLFGKFSKELQESK